MGRHYRTYCGGVVKGNGCNANATSGGDIRAWCTLWRINFMTKKYLGLEQNVANQQRYYNRHLQGLLKWKRNAWIPWKTLNATIKHWLPWRYNIEEMLNICEGDPTKFKPHASCMYFGRISNYADGNKVHKNAKKYHEDGHMIWHHGVGYSRCFLTIYEHY